MRKYLSNVHKIGGAHLQCMSNHLAKFEYKGMKTVGGTDYTNYAPQTCCGQTDGQTNRRTDGPNGRTDGRSGPTTRPAFAKATQVRMQKEKHIGHIWILTTAR